MTRRRARASKLTNGIHAEDAAATAGKNSKGIVLAGSRLTNGNLLRADDQYFASPKRKDCKIDNAIDVAAGGANVLADNAKTEQNTTTSNRIKNQSPGKSKADRHIGLLY